MSRSFPQFSRETLKALLEVVGALVPTKAIKALTRIKQGGDVRQELLVPVRMIVFDLLGDEQYQRYQQFERQALQGDEGARSSWMNMLATCRMLLRQPRQGGELAWVLAN